MSQKAQTAIYSFKVYFSNDYVDLYGNFDLENAKRVEGELKNDKLIYTILKDVVGEFGSEAIEIKSL